MISRWMRAAWLLALTPAAALAFESIDGIPWPATGRFPAYGAEGIRPWGLFAQAGFMHDDNVLRLTEGERSDTIMRYGAGIRGEALIYGRQRLLLDALAEYNDFDTFSELDHFAYGLRGEWLWEVGNDLSGTAGYRRRKRLADIGEVQRASRDLITEQRWYAFGGYRLGADWRLSAGTEYFKLEHSRPGPTPERDGASVRGGIEHVSTLGNAIGLAVRYSQGDAPVAPELGIGSFPDNQYEEREVAATFSYGLGPTLRVGGRVGRTTRTYTDLPGRNFNGTTGRGLIEWVATPKVMMTLEAFREPHSVIDADALHVIRRGLAFGPSWAPTIKLVFYARFVNERWINQGDPAVELGAPLRDETMRLWRFGAGWEADRRWQISTGFDHGERESNTLDRDYKYNALVVNLRFVF